MARNVEVRISFAPVSRKRADRRGTVPKEQNEQWMKFRRLFRIMDENRGEIIWSSWII